MASWAKVKLIYLREIRDQLRDRRTLFTIAVLPLFLYPLLGMSVLQITQFMRNKPIHVLVLGAENLPQDPRLIVTEGEPHFAPEFAPDGVSDKIQLELKAELPAGWKVEREDAVKQVAPPPRSADDRKPATDRLPTKLEELARQQIQQGRYDAVLFIPDDFAQKLVAFRRELVAFQAGSPETRHAPQQFEGPHAFADSSREKSMVAATRVKRILDNWCQAIGRQNLEQSNLPPIVTSPFKVEEVKGPAESRRQAMLWSKILPFVAMIWALTGAFYPAIDLCAGEKERGTLETLLSSPALRSEIVWGKLLTVMSFSLATSLLNLISLTATGSFIISHMEGAGGSLPMGPPPLSALGWLTLTLLPISALFSGLSLAIASFARSSKEGQYYLMPLLLICLPLMMLPMPSSSELDLGTSLIPITGVMLLLRTLIEGEYLKALMFAPPVMGVTALGCLLSIRWAIDQFNNESVLFNESERWSLGVWLRHMLRDRDATPTFGMAILCGLVLLLIRFFVGFSLSEKQPTDFRGFAISTIVFQVALIATPALLMTIMLTRDPRITLSLRMPPLLALPAGILLALFIHPAGMIVSEAFSQLYEMNPEVIKELEKFEGVFQSAPNFWCILGVMALTPAICEELAFRGFVLSGLCHSGKKWTAIIISAVFFGAIHGILQQSLPACVLGVVLGFVAVQTRSIFPAMLFHLTYNSLSMFLALEAKNWIGDYPVLGFFYKSDRGEILRYNPIFAALSFIVAIGLLYWFRSLSYASNAEENLPGAIDRQSLPVPTGERG